MQRFDNLYAAYRKLLATLEKDGFGIKYIHPVNQNRYFIIDGTLNDERYPIMITFKRDTFHNFGAQFRKKGMSGVGDSINVEDLKNAARHEVSYIYAIFPNGHAYGISFSDFIANSYKWLNKEGKEIRSISIHEYTLVYKL